MICNSADINYYEEDSEEENQQNSEAGQTNAPETHDAFDKVHYHFMIFLL